MAMTTNNSNRISVMALVAVLMAMSLVAANYASASNWRDVNYLIAWIVAQWMPIKSLRNELQAQAWMYWEDRYEKQQNEQHSYYEALSATSELAIPTVDVQLYDSPMSLRNHLTKVYGSDWRKRPLLFRNLWSEAELSDPNRRLSLQGLLQEDSLHIPYFTDARLDSALSPNNKASVAAIMTNITQGMPHKIGSQFLVQEYPELIREIAPVALLTELFGDYFTPDRVEGSGPFHLFPALTTVPVFVASTRHFLKSSPSSSSSSQQGNQPYTALHCEPIGNIAVQLSGAKQWTLVDPAYSFLIRPSTSPDGRAFFASWRNLKKNDKDRVVSVPTYTATTGPGDAVWVPTWTWHRVDYAAAASGDDNNGGIAIGGSLFHFRFLDFWANNPLFAVLLLPAMVLELIGYNTQ